MPQALDDITMTEYIEKRVKEHLKMSLAERQKTDWTRIAGVCLSVAALTAGFLLFVFETKSNAMVRDVIIRSNKEAIVDIKKGLEKANSALITTNENIVRIAERMGVHNVKKVRSEDE